MVILRVSLDILDDVLYHIQAGCHSTEIWSTHITINNAGTWSVVIMSLISRKKITVYKIILI